MKKLLLLLLFISSLGFSQEIPMIEGTDKIGFSERISTPNATPSEVYSELKNYLIRKNADDNFSVDQPDNILIDQMNFPVTIMSSNYPIPYTVLYNLTAEFKEGEIQVTLSDYKISQNAAGTTRETTLSQWIESIDNAKRGRRKMRETKANMLQEINEEAGRILNEIKELDY